MDTVHQELTRCRTLHAQLESGDELGEENDVDSEDVVDDSDFTEVFNSDSACVRDAGSVGVINSDSVAVFNSDSAGVEDADHLVTNA